MWSTGTSSAMLRERRKAACLHRFEQYIRGRPVFGCVNAAPHSLQVVSMDPMLRIYVTLGALQRGPRDARAAVVSRT